jgi:hypothetical protein
MAGHGASHICAQREALRRAQHDIDSAGPERQYRPPRIIFSGRLMHLAAQRRSGDDAAVGAATVER